MAQDDARASGRACRSLRDRVQKGSATCYLISLGGGTARATRQVVIERRMREKLTSTMWIWEGKRRRMVNDWNACGLHWPLMT